MKTNRTYKKIMRLYSLIMIFILACVFIFYLNVNRQLIQKYNSFFYLYETLGAFYDSQGQSHAYSRNYLYTESEEELDKYSEELNKSKALLQEMEQNDYMENVYWRFDLLSNMLESYDSQVKNVISLKNEEGYKDAYNELMEINKVISQTSEEYYEMVTDELEKVQNVIESDKQNTIYVSIGLLIILMIGFILFSILIKRSITDPIDELVKDLDVIKIGNYDFRKLKVHSNEMEVLCNALQDFSDSIHKNVEYEKEKAQLQTELLKKENENLKKDELLVSSELKILQSQLNPHFLFNTMNMIYQQAIKEKAQITVNMIEKMTECMRYSLNQKIKTSTLPMEIDFVRNYIYIQNKRFEGRILFTLDVDDELPNIKIPSMIIEPIIENSVKHGLSNIEENGEVSIGVHRINEKIKICVSDNGKGISSDELETLVVNKFKTESQKENLGLYNIYRRLYMYFSDEATISINSFEDCGFETIITLPIERR